MRFTAIPLALLLSSCANIGPTDLANDPTNTPTTIASPLPPAVAYRHLVSGARRCQDKVGGRIETDYFPDISEGSVDWKVSGDFGMTHVTIVHYQVKEATQGSSITVRQWLRSGSETWMVRAAKEWLAGNHAACQ